ncbi:hypothetical protein ACR3K2_20850 [Cryptosporidium serpentis]
MDEQPEGYSEYRKLKQNFKLLQDELQKRKKAEQEMEDELRRLHEETIPLSAARALTHVALCKGRALEILSSMTSSNSVSTSNLRWAFRNLYKHTFGEIAYAKRLGEDRSAQYHYNETQLRLFRQEQLLLLAENERLSTQVKNLQVELVQNYKAIRSDKIGGVRSGRRKAQGELRVNTNSALSEQDSGIDSVTDSEIELDSNADSEASSCIALNVELVTRHLSNLVHCIQSAFQRRKLFGLIVWRMATQRVTSSITDRGPTSTNIIHTTERSGRDSTSYDMNRFFELLQRRFRYMLMARGFWRIWCSCFSPLFRRKVNCGVVRGPSTSAFRAINDTGLMVRDSFIGAGMGGGNDVAYMTIQGGTPLNTSTAFATQPHYLANLPSFSKVSYAPRNVYFQSRDIPPFPPAKDQSKTLPSISYEESKGIPPFFRSFGGISSIPKQTPHRISNEKQQGGYCDVEQNDVYTAKSELSNLLNFGQVPTSPKHYPEFGYKKVNSRGPLDDVTTKLKYLDILAEAIDDP